jgi:hypothetical protein
MHKLSNVSLIRKPNNAAKNAAYNMDYSNMDIGGTRRQCPATVDSSYRSLLQVFPTTDSRIAQLARKT